MSSSNAEKNKAIMLEAFEPRLHGADQTLSRLGTDWLNLIPGQNPTEQAGLEVACRVLDFLVSHGLKLRSRWENRIEQPAIGEPQTAKVAIVEGAIPAALVVAHFAMPGELFPCINLLEVRPDRIRVVGLTFEEYLILASG
jgi:hypothetical protein